MEKVIDLHCHSNHSDGSMTPTELVRHAKKNNISAIALSDHDTVSGVALALAEGARVGVEVIPAIEISVSAKTETHIVGLFIDFSEKNLTEKIRKSLNARRVRNGETCAKLNELGFDITLDEVYALAPSGRVGRVHFARIMVEKGYISSVKEGFERYLGMGKPAFDSTQALTAREAVETINAIGGLSFVAHPHLIGLPEQELILLLSRLKEHGLDGIEAYYNDFTPEMQAYFNSLAEEMGLAVCGGTDFHAQNKPHIEIGIGQGYTEIPYSVLERLKVLHDEKFNK